jgi:Nuclease-related domain
MLRHADEPGKTPEYRHGDPANVDSKPPVRSGHVGVAGASARREFERRRSAREARTRAEHPHIGGLLLALQEAPQHETAWARGAEGESRVAASLAKRVHAGVVLMHDRAIPGTRSNIDHIAVASSGVWVIDAKRYSGKVAIRRPLFGRRRLTIAGRDVTRLAEGLAGQVEVVRAVVDEIGGGVPIQGCLCFVDADLSMLGTLILDGFVLAYPKGLSARINARGPVPDARVREIARKLAERLPAR